MRRCLGPMVKKRLPPILLAAALILLCASCSSPLRDQVRAEKLESEGHLADALKIYQDALSRVAPNDRHQISQLYVRIGECLWRLGQGSEALTAFQQAIDIDASNLLAHIKIGTIYL